MKCTKGFELEVLCSGAGYYIGTVTTEDGFPEPYCRLSACYYGDRESAKDALNNLSFPTREYSAECEFCNHGMGCLTNL